MALCHTCMHTELNAHGSGWPVQNLTRSFTDTNFGITRSTKVLNPWRKYCILCTTPIASSPGSPSLHTILTYDGFKGHMLKLCVERESLGTRLLRQCACAEIGHASRCSCKPMVLSSLVTSRPTHKGKGHLVNIERFLGPNTFWSVKTGSPIILQHCQS